MSTLKAPIKNSGDNDFEPAPEGMHVARCFRVIDLGTQYIEKWEKYTRKVVLMWEIPDLMFEYENKDGEIEMRPQSVLKRYTLSAHPKSNLRADLESWYGKTFNDRDLELAGGFDLSKVVGRPCMLNVVHNEYNGKTYANVRSVNPLPKGMDCPDAINEQYCFSLDDFDPDIFDKLGGFQDQIRESVEWEEMTNPAVEEEGGDEPPLPEEPEDLDDQIPFAAVLVPLTGILMGLSGLLV